ncbi:hypothetical protein [Oceanicoccus sagamiensis]|uniref:DUF5666 domain-containing protein n=1 Tax=Oceanicoccus sagamiensis TaxID=716816 RepID=A0A1X9NB62_9GAMM|nr:hypothetical protein [Oceanicoccus sagamiensis]ARN72779.1 hypothetical protein BST96_00810 [Oceanicoccus sagamiensis]
MKFVPVKVITVFVSVLLASSLLSADTLTLNDGQVIEGKFVARDDQNVTFEIAGQQLKFATANVKSIAMDMAAPAAAAPAPAPAEPVAAAPAKPEKVTVPEGTRVMARMAEALDSKKHKAGHKFTARLEADMVVDGVVVAPRGATLYGVLTDSKSSGRAAGSSSMQMTFTDIMVNNQLHPIATTDLKAKTDNTAKKTGGTVAKGALLGGLMGGSDDAKRGAAIGLGLSVLTSGNQINIPRGTLIEFQLRTPLTI